ncbi:MAG: aminotransferase [Firmicutes bacterium HGW-Firmicutes-12]|jgi:alanine-synthesizing transaminase|nr:MAG: aminotransferase [Firmicutes bacterium HGW-Firmicutes-12]
MDYRKSDKLAHVCYDIRGPVMEEAKRLEEAGHKLLKLNIGNPAPFGFDAPDEIIQDVILNLRNAQGYTDSNGLFAARKAIMQDSQKKKIEGVLIDDIYIGNGVSELIVMCMQGLLNNGDEILIPAPDYPLWTAAVNLSGGEAIHYICDEEANWIPDIDDIKRKITDRTKGIAVINPNNPTGAIYPKEILEKIVEIAIENNLIIFADEIYDKVLYDDNKHIAMASLSDEIFFVTLNGLSKSHRIAGFRAGWMVLSGNKKLAKDYIEGLNILSNMRLCSNVPAQFAIQTALGGYQSLLELLQPSGRLHKQRELCYELVNQIPGLSCTKPEGAFYVFPKLDVKRFNITDDRQFVFDFLRAKKVMLVQGSGFNWPNPDHFRIVFLPPVDELTEAINKLGDFLSTYKQI